MTVHDTAPRAFAPPAGAAGPAKADLDAAAERYRRHLPPGRLRVYDVSALDDLGLAFYAACYVGDEGFVMDGFGYGATAEEAMVGALGEISETAHVDHALKTAPGANGVSYTAMCRAFGADSVVDPLRLCLPAGTPYTATTPLKWVGVRRWPDGAPAWAPRECVAISPGQWAAHGSEDPRAPTPEGEAQMLFRPITCGLGAGTSVEMALAHGVLELLQRDGNCTSFRAMDRGWSIDLDGLEDPGLVALADHLEGHGLAMRPKLASTEFGLANLFVVGEPRDGAPEPRLPIQFTACGEAVHPDAEMALRKAAYEFVGARCRKAFMHGPLDAVRRAASDDYLDDYVATFDPAGEEPRALEAMRDWVHRDGADLAAILSATLFRETRRVGLGVLPRAPRADWATPAARLATVAGRLARAGHPLYWFDASPDGGDTPVVVKTLAPGLEGETMSYYRIGMRGVRRLLDREPTLAGIGAAPEGAEPVAMTAEDADRLGGPAWFSPARAAEIVGSAYPLYREPSSHAVRLTEPDGRR
ncbi:MAG: YcaO-like family protein [Paracoccaceae bacterium]